MEADDIKRLLPFNAYDFFGYLLPGIVFVSLLCIWQFYAFYHGSIEVFSEWNKFISDGGLVGGILIIAVVISTLYFSGHIVATISHVFFDRILVRDILGYPFEKLLDKNSATDSMLQTKMSSNKPFDGEPIYSSAFLFLQALVFMGPIFVEITSRLYNAYHHSDPNMSNKSIADIGLYIFATFQIFNVMLIGQWISKSLSTKVKYPFVDAVCNFVYLKIVLISRSVFEKITACDVPMNEETVKKFNTKFKKTFGYKGPPNSDWYWMSTILLQKDPVAYRNMSNWLNLYGYLKNFSMASILVAFIISTYHWKLIIWDHQACNLVGSRMLLAMLFFGVILASRYWIIYRNYYTKYIVRSVAALK